MGNLDTMLVLLITSCSIIIYSDCALKKVALPCMIGIKLIYVSYKGFLLSGYSFSLSDSLNLLFGLKIRGYFLSLTSILLGGTMS